MSNRICSIEGCGRFEHARGWCGRHYGRWLTNGDPNISKITPCIPGCKCGRHTNNRYKKRVESLPCAFCGKTRMVMASLGPDATEPVKYCDRGCYEKERRRIIADRRANGICRIYDMSSEEFDLRLAAQAYRCAICLNPIDKSAHRDHCHESGEWRGLLCRKCNSGLGMFGDDVDNLGRAWAYLVMGGVSIAQKA
jgi:hypothetical protein